MSIAPSHDTMAALEQGLTAALDTIRTHWHALLEPVLDASAKIGNEPTTGSKTTLTATEARVSLRYEVTLSLNSWARIVIEDRALTHRLPYGTDTLGLVALIKRHATWLSGHEAAPDAALELGKLAGRVEAMALGNTVSRIQVGRCPEIILLDTEELTHCDGNLWATLHRSDGLLPKHIVCDTSPDHSWKPHEWASLGRRIGTTGTSGGVETVA